MEIMTQAGLTPLQVLRSATSNGAKTMGMERGIGTLGPGRLADPSSSTRTRSPM